MNAAVIPSPRPADSLHASPQVRTATSADSTETDTAGGTAADDTQTEAADSTTLIHTGNLSGIGTTPDNTTAETTRIWFTQGPLHVRYGDQSHPLFRTTTDASEVFGTASQVAPAYPFTASKPHPLTGNIVFQGAVLLLTAGYIILIYRHLSDAVLLFSRLTRTHTAGGDRLSDDPGGSGFSRFLNVAVIIGLLFAGVAAVKAGDLFLPPNIVAVFPPTIIPFMGTIAILAMLALAVYQSITLHLAGALTLAQPFIAQLMYLKRIHFVLLVLVTTPALLLFALCPPQTGKIWFYVIAVLLVITTVLYLRESLNLFLSKKISILHWFLYLCTVEIFPVSFLWLAAAR